MSKPPAVKPAAVRSAERPRAIAFAETYIARLREVLDRMQPAAIAAFVEILLDARERGARIFFIGNGGSAATATHFANDIALGSRAWDRPFHALSLTDNVACVTAIANDYGYEQVFAVQLKTQMVPGDVVVAISASGNSPNVVKAIEHANAHGGVTVALTGFDGGRLRQIAQLSVHVPSHHGEYGPVEDVHLILDHVVAAYLQELCQSERGTDL